MACRHLTHCSARAGKIVQASHGSIGSFAGCCDRPSNNSAHDRREKSADRRPRSRCCRTVCSWIGFPCCAYCAMLIDGVASQQFLAFADNFGPGLRSFANNSASNGPADRDMRCKGRPQKVSSKTTLLKLLDRHPPGRPRRLAPAELRSPPRYTPASRCSWP